MPSPWRGRLWRHLAVACGISLGAALPLSLHAANDAAPAANEAETATDTIAKCIADLANPDVGVRKRAVLILAKYDRQDARAGIIQALYDADPMIRLSALVSLTEEGRIDPRAIGKMLQMISDPDVQVRRHASYHAQTTLMYAQGRLTPELQQILVTAFRDPDATVRKNMINIYNFIGELVPADTLAGLLQDPEREIRILALNACEYGLTGDRLGQALAGVVDDADPLVRQRLAELLGERQVPGGDRLLQTLANDKVFKVSAAARLGRFRQAPTKAAYMELRPLLDSPELDQEQGRQLIDALTALGPEAEPLLRELLNHPRQSYRLRALANYGNIYDGRNPTLLLGLLADDARAVREAAMQLLRQFNSQLPLETVTTLTASKFADVRAASVGFTSNLKLDAASPLLLDLILDDDLTVRSLALLEIGRRQVDGWEDILNETLHDTDSRVAMAGAEALFRIGTPNAIALVTNFLRTTDNAETRAAIQRRFDQLRQPSANLEAF